MLFDKEYLDEILKLGRKDIAEYCDDYLDAETLSAHLEQDEPFIGRKELCQYLGVGESTLTGWLKEDRIPLMAKEAFLLPLVIRVLGDEIKRLREEEEKPRILKNRDIYQICHFVPDERGEAIGKVIADNISEVQQARVMVAGVKALSLLNEVDDDQLQFLIEYFEGSGDNECYLEYLYKVRKDIRMCMLYACDYKTWGKLNTPIKPNTSNKDPAEFFKRYLASKDTAETNTAPDQNAADKGEDAS